MATGPQFFIEIRLRLAATGPGLVDYPDLDEIADGLEELFGKDSGWRSQLERKEYTPALETHPALATNPEHQIVFAYRNTRTPTVPDIETRSDIVYRLARTLCDKTNPLSLGKISKGVENILYMPWMHTSRDPVSRHLQELFNHHLILFTLQRTIGNPSFEEIGCEAGKLWAMPEECKWFRGPLKVGVFLSDFMNIFGGLASLLPVEKDLPQDTKAAILLRLLKNGTDLASILRTVCAVNVGNLDEDGIRRELRMADDRVKTAMAAASDELQNFLDNYDRSPDGTTGRIISRITTTLTQSIKDLHEARAIASRASERANADFNETKWQLIRGAAVLICGLGLMLFGAPVGGMLVTDVLGWGGTLTAGGRLAIISRKPIIQWSKIAKTENYIKGLDDLQIQSVNIHTFFALTALRATGKLSDDDERLVEFAKQYAKLFEGADVLEEWKDPRYIRSRVTQEHDYLKDSIQRFKALLKDIDTESTTQSTT